jgi:type IV pilus assembly protein PilC
LAKFKYEAVDSDGRVISSAIKAENLNMARQTLASRSLDVNQIRESRGFLSMQIGKGRVPRMEIMHFSRQLAAFIRAGVPLVEALSVIEEEVDRPAWRNVLTEMQLALNQGRTLSQAAGEHTHAFPPFFLSMLRSAELTGQLDLVLDQSARYIERDEESKRKIRAALAYPAMIFAVAVVAVVVLSVFVLPRFKVFFESLNATLPLPTRLLLGFTGWLGKWWWLILAILIVLGILLRFWTKTVRGRRAWHRFLLKIPLIGEIIRYIIVERFSRMLSALVQSGVPMPEAMETVRDATTNVVYREAIESVRVAMLEGEGLSQPIVRTGVFPGALTQMVRVGEGTGTLDTQLANAAMFYEQELEFKLKRLTTLFEPTMIIFVGVSVGFVAVALVSAMYGIFRQVGEIQ